MREPRVKLTFEKISPHIVVAFALGLEFEIVRTGQRGYLASVIQREGQRAVTLARASVKAQHVAQRWCHVEAERLLAAAGARHERAAAGERVGGAVCEPSAQPARAQRGTAGGSAE